MNKTFFLPVIICMIGISVTAQTADIMVSYKYFHPVQTMRSPDADITNRYILLSDGDRSKFYSPATEYIDSIESTPEGFESFNMFKRACYEKKQPNMIPRVDGSFYVTKSFKTKTILTFDIASATKFKWEEPLTEIEWNVTDSTKNILGYECFKAYAEYHGRKWNAWFTPDIPLRDGPWKLQGLPGLILEAVCDGGQYRFVADGVQMVRNPFYGIYLATDWECISGRDFWELRRKCLDNQSRGINAQANSIVWQGINYDSYLPKNIVDYIETDY